MHTKAAATGTANTHARAGERIAGNLYRGGGGQFQGGPGAQLQKRLAEIRAKRAGKGRRKAGGKGKAAKKPAKPTPEQRKQAQAAEQAATRESTLKETGLGEDARASLDDLIAGKDVEDDGGLEKLGLAERGKDGKLRLTSAGRAVHRAAGRGDVGTVKDAMSRAKERAATRAERQKQRKAKRRKKTPGIAGGFEKKDSAMTIDTILEDLEAVRDELASAATKAGRRNNSADQASIDQGYEMAMELCDIFEALGADTGEEEGEGEMDMAEEGMEGKADATFEVYGSAVKALPGDAVGAYAVRFGSVDEPDMSPLRDYFTKSTDFWLDAWDRRPMLFHHAMDEDTADAPRIGTWTKAEIKDEGVWLEGQLDKAHRYYGAIKELVRRGVLRLSSDSAPHLVRRAVKGNTHEVTRWPLLAASLTPTPAEPRLTAVSFKALLAEFGLNDNDPEVQTPSGERSDGTKAADERARRLLLRTRLLALQE